MHFHKPDDYCDPECPPLDWVRLVQDLVELLPTEAEAVRLGKDWNKLTQAKDMAEGYLKTNKRYGR